MPTNILVGDTIRIQVTFRNWATVGDGEIIDPETVTVDLLDEELNRTPEIEEATKVEDGVYYFDWTPLEAGLFYVEFIGTFSDGNTSVVREQFTVVKVADGEAGSFPGSALGEDQELVFATALEPMLIDPDEILLYYPDASAVEAASLIYRFSTEVIKLFGNREPTFTAIEYIRAAVLCALSRIYDYAGGDASSLTLGDLSISNQSYPRNNITRANAANWCELAAALRLEMIRGEANIKAVVKGTRHPDPMPKRKIKSPYHGNGRRTL